MADKVEKNKVVTFTYSILDQGGGVLEQYDVPLSYLHGVDGKMYEKVERAMEGKQVGDEVRVDVSSEESFGPYDPELTYTDELDNVPPEFRHLGAKATFENPEGEQITMVVSKIEDGQITLDGNHPFAGKNLTFVIRILGIREATVDEIGRGEAMDNQMAPPSLH